jgi:hypothetical protein
MLLCMHLKNNTHMPSLLKEMYYDLGKEPSAALLRHIVNRLQIVLNSCTVHVFYLEDISSEELISFGSKMPI